MIRLPLNNQVFINKPSMRERSGGIYCDSYEELIDIMDSHAQRCPNIEDFLRDQESNSLHQSVLSDYFFEPLRQMQQEEQDELERTQPRDLSCRLVRTEIAIICQQLESVLCELLDHKGIHQFYSTTCLPSTEPIQSLHVAIEGSTVSVSSRGNDVSPQIEVRSRQFEQRGELSQVQEGEAKLASQTSSEPGQNRLLQLVIYYNRVQQGQTLPNTQQSLSSPKSAFQHKIWLVQQTDHCKQLLATYTESAEFLYTATQNPYSLNDVKKTIYQQIRPSSTSPHGQSQSSIGGCVLRDVLGRVEAMRQCK